VGFKLEEIARSEAVIAKMREENRAMEAVIEEYKRREGEFEELKKTVDGYRRNSEEAMKMAQEIAIKFKEIQERERKIREEEKMGEEEKKEEEMPPF